MFLYVMHSMSIDEYRPRINMTNNYLIIDGETFIKLKQISSVQMATGTLNIKSPGILGTKTSKINYDIIKIKASDNIYSIEYRPIKIKDKYQYKSDVKQLKKIIKQMLPYTEQDYSAIMKSIYG